MKEYNPKPIDLSEVELPDNLTELREAIAENAHDIWALSRKNEGWTYGPNGKTLFLPLAGDISDNNTNIQGKDAYVIFWTANLHADNRKTYEFAMSHLNNYWYSSERNTGHNIRAVHK